MAIKKRRRSIHKQKVEYHSSSSDEEILENENNEPVIKKIPEKEGISDGDKSENENSDNEEIENNKEGWADAMLKVLTKTGPKDTQTMILPKEKFPQDQNKKVLSSTKAERKKKLQLKREWEDMGHIKPDILEKDYERALQKTATRGVIQLFNAVKKHQNEMGEKLKSAKTEQKKEKVYKNLDRGKFLRMLRGENKSDLPDDESKITEEEQPAWKALRDDHMTGKKMADWDKETSDQENDKVSKKKRKVR